MHSSPFWIFLFLQSLDLDPPLPAHSRVLHRGSVVPICSFPLKAISPTPFISLHIIVSSFSNRSNHSLPFAPDRSGWPERPVQIVRAFVIESGRFLNRVH